MEIKPPPLPQTSRNNIFICFPLSAALQPLYLTQYVSGNNLNELQEGTKIKSVDYI